MSKHLLTVMRVEVFKLLEEDGKARLIDIVKKTVERTYNLGSISQNALCYSPRNNCMLASDSRKCTYFFSANSQQPVMRCFTTEVVTCCAVSSCGTLLVCGCSNGVVLLWSLVTGQLFRNVKAHLRRINCVAFSGPDSSNSMFCTASDDSTCKVWSTSLFLTPAAQRTAPLCTFTNHSLEVNCCTFKPGDETVIATGSADKSVRLFDALSGQELKSFIVGDVVTCVAFSDAGAMLAAGTALGTLCFWSLTRPLQRLPIMTTLTDSGAEADREMVVVRPSSEGHSSPIRFLIFSSSGSGDGAAGTVLSVSESWRILEYDYFTGRVVSEVVERQKGKIVSCRWFPSRRPGLPILPKSGFSLSKNPLESGSQSCLLVSTPIRIAPSFCEKRRRTETSAVVRDGSSSDKRHRLEWLTEQLKEIHTVEKKLQKRLGKLQASRTTPE